jgi:hypothetical protein
MSDRATKLVVTSREQMDLEMAHKKCKILWIQPAAAVGPTMAADVAALGLDHTCDCGKPFFVCNVGLQVHLRTCGTANTVMEVAEDGTENYPLEALLEVRGPPSRRFWRVKWDGVDDDGTNKFPNMGTRTGLHDD